MVTNGLTVALVLERASPRISVVVTGGTLRPLQHSLVNPLGTVLLEQPERVDRLHRLQRRRLRGRRDQRQPARGRGQARDAARARRRVIVADGSKLGEVEVAKICDLAEVSLVVTDSSADPSILAGPRGGGVRRAGRRRRAIASPRDGIRTGRLATTLRPRRPDAMEFYKAAFGARELYRDGPSSTGGRRPALGRRSVVLGGRRITRAPELQPRVARRGTVRMLLIVPIRRPSCSAPSAGRHGGLPGGRRARLAARAHRRPVRPSLGDRQAAGGLAPASRVLSYSSTVAMPAAVSGPRPPRPRASRRRARSRWWALSDDLGRLGVLLEVGGALGARDRHDVVTLVPAPRRARAGPACTPTSCGELAHRARRGARLASRFSPWKRGW